MSKKGDIQEQHWFKHKQEMYRREVFVFLKSLLIIISVLSLLSYNPADPSWAMISTAQSVVANWCGMWGAWFSAFMFYLLGLGAYVFACFIAVHQILSWLFGMRKRFFKTMFFFFI